MKQYFLQKFNQYTYFSESNTLQGHLQNIKLNYILVETIKLLAKKRYLYYPGNPLQENNMQDCILFKIIYIVLK